MIAAGITSGHVLLADWLFLIAAVLFVLYAFVVNGVNVIPNGRGAAIQALALALVAIGLLVL